jgi:hypothetical protein
MAAMLRTALQLAARGLHVFPCAPGEKTPACAHGCKEATIDSITIQAWWRSCPDFNIGIATGSASNLFVIDIDGEDGEQALRRLEAAHTSLPPTVEAITPRGRHIYFKWPQSPVRNTAAKVADGIDTRGDGGYVLAPPSLHPSGRRYAWSVDSAAIFAEAPQWLLDRITAPKNRNGKSVIPASEWRELVANGAMEGTRDCSATKLAGYLLRRCIDPVVVLELMQCWNATRCTPPLPVEDIERVVNSVAGRELRRRGGG